MIRRTSLCLATAVLASACSGTDQSPSGDLVDPALVGPDHWREICVSRRYADHFTVGVATVTNDSDESLELTELTLTEPDGITLEGADFLVRDGRVDSFGVWNGYPPFGLAKDPLFSDLWSKREPIAGGTIEPGENVSFLLHLTGDAGIATAGPIEVTYQDESGDTGTWVSNVRYRIRWRCQSGFPYPTGPLDAEVGGAQGGDGVLGALEGQVADLGTAEDEEDELGGPAEDGDGVGTSVQRGRAVAVGARQP